MVITIDTGYQNRPSWLWQTTSFITGSHAHSVFMTGPRSRRRRWLFFFFFVACQLSIPNQTGYIRGVQYCNRVCIWMFLVRYIVTGCIFVRRAQYDRVRFWPPQRHPPIQLRSRVPPPPPPGCTSIYFTHSGYRMTTSVVAIWLEHSLNFLPFRLNEALSQWCVAWKFGKNNKNSTPRCQVRVSSHLLAGR